MLAYMLAYTCTQGEPLRALPMHEQALKVFEQALGPGLSALSSLSLSLLLSLGLGSSVQCLGFRVKDLGSRVKGLGSRVLNYRDPNDENALQCFTRADFRAP